jgi:hypothetical protein
MALTVMEERDLGPQPLAEILDAWGLSNHDLVDVSPEQLTHKQVQKARSGRRLTLKMKQKIARTVNFAVWGRLKNEEREEFTEYFPKHLFSYHKGYQAGDPNAVMYGNLSDRKVRVDFLRELSGEES